VPLSERLLIIRINSCLCFHSITGVIFFVKCPPCRDQAGERLECPLLVGTYRFNQSGNFI
jgi:hypothetical protein